MKAAQLFGPGDLRVVDIPMPVPGPEEVLLRVARFAPYGTDVGTFLNRGGRYGSNYPFGIGADFSGTVEAILAIRSRAARARAGSPRPATH